VEFNESMLKYIHIDTTLFVGLDTFKSTFIKADHEK